MSFDIDEGQSGSAGPWISWKPKGTDDRAVPRASFMIVDTDGGKDHFKGFERGVVADIENMQTGWRCWDDASNRPDFRPNPSLTKWAPQPGDKYRRAIKIRIAYSSGGDGILTALWEDQGVAAYTGFMALKDDLVWGSKANPGQLPVIKLVSTEDVKYGANYSVIPHFEIVKWVPRPAALQERADHGFAIEEGDDDEWDGPSAPPAAAARQPKRMATRADLGPRVDQPRVQRPSRPSQRAVDTMNAAASPHDDALIDDEIPF